MIYFFKFFCLLTKLVKSHNEGSFFWIVVGDW